MGKEEKSTKKRKVEENKDDQSKVASIPPVYHFVVMMCDEEDEIRSFLPTQEFHDAKKFFLHRVKKLERGLFREHVDCGEDDCECKIEGKTYVMDEDCETRPEFVPGFIIQDDVVKRLFDSTGNLVKEEQLEGEDFAIGVDFLRPYHKVKWIRHFPPGAHAVYGMHIPNRPNYRWNWVCLAAIPTEDGRNLEEDLAAFRQSIKINEQFD